MIQTGVNDYLLDTIQAGASDLHITVGLPPMILVQDQYSPSTVHR